jgi:hypothetical protein
LLALTKWSANRRSEGWFDKACHPKKRPSHR